MIEASLWTAQAVAAPAARTELPAATEIAVVGAGYTGLAAALALARRGVRTTVLEGEQVGFGASSRNGGMVLTGLKLGPEALLRRYGEARARAFFDASLAAIDSLERLIARERIECAYARSGHIEVACTARHFQTLARTQSVLEHTFHHPVALLSCDDLRSELGSNVYAGGLLDERSGSLDPYRYALGLAEAARRAGAAIVESAAVRQIERRGNGWRLVTTQGELTCDGVLIATGAYGGPEFSTLQRRIVPVGSYVIATERLPPSLAKQLVPNNRMVFDTKRLLHYFRLTPDSRVLFGGRAAFLPANRESTRRSARILSNDMSEVFPQLRDAKVDYTWGGTLDVTFDLMPHAGTLEGRYFATGYAGHGVALATLLGTLAAEAMIEKRDLRPFDRPLPRAPFALYDGRPWFLPLVGAWQRLADMVG